MKNEIRKERTHLFAPSINIVVRICFTEKIVENELAAAAQAAVRNNEVLNSRITLDDKGTAFYETVDAEDLIIQKFKGDWKDIVTEQEKIPFKLTKGEWVRFFFKEKGTSELLMIVHHLAGDGMAVIYLAQDIVRNLNGEALEYRKQQQFDMNKLPKGSRLNWLMRLLMHGMDKKWRKTGRVFSIDDYQRMHSKYWAEHKTQIQSVIMEGEQLRRLEEEAKCHHVTVNSILVTALAKAEENQMEIGIAVDLREEKNVSMANYSTAVSLQYQYDLSRNFWDNAEQVHRLIYEILGNNKRKFFLIQFMKHVSPTLVDAAYFAAFDGYSNKTACRISELFGYLHPSNTVNISNLTKVDLSVQSSKYHVESLIFVPPLIPNSAYIIGAVTANQHLALTLHALQDDRYTVKTDAFEKMIYILNQLGSI